jgi:hypothetical protein
MIDGAPMLSLGAEHMPVSYFSSRRGHGSAIPPYINLIVDGVAEQRVRTRLDLINDSLINSLAAFHVGVDAVEDLEKVESTVLAMSDGNLYGVVQLAVAVIFDALETTSL